MDRALRSKTEIVTHTSANECGMWDIYFIIKIRAHGTLLISRIAFVQIVEITNKMD